MTTKNLNENLLVGAEYIAAQQVIMDGLYPPPFMENLGDAASGEFDRIFDEAMIFIYGDYRDC
jgi:hypothetical protein